MSTAVDLSLLTRLDPEALTAAGDGSLLRELLNLLEQLVTENQAQRDQLQRLQDEINRLKGEQGKPTFKPKKPPLGATNYSSEQERREPKTWQKGTKLDQIKIDRVERRQVDPATLPDDAISKGTETVTVQDLILRTDNVQFELELWYSPSQRRRYRAPLPAGYEGEFGPGVKTLALQQTYGANVSQGKLLELFRQAGLKMSSGWLATLLSGDPGELAAEARAVEQAGLAGCCWIHGDTTSTPVDGATWWCHVQGNPLFTAYHTLPKQDRLAVLAVLGGGGPLSYLWNTSADAYLDEMEVSVQARRYLSRVPRDQVVDEASLTGLLEPLFRWVGPKQRTWFREALALAAYRAQAAWPVSCTLLSDDAAQYRLVTQEHALCWIHEGRHFKKLVAHVPLHRELLATFGTDFWNFYRELLAYREQPTPAEATRLELRFDTLFSRTTGFELLDHRIALTREKKTGLLLVLQHPELPLHNNPAELAARRRVRKRNVSFGPKSAAGAKAWDTFMTLAATTQKLGVSFFAYLQDRLHQAGRIPPLADLIHERAATLNLSASWTPA
jgi:transposase IS66 family protein